MRHTHSQQLERWLGTENVEHLSQAMRDWYGPPIAISGVPGRVWAAKGGDFVGPIEAGYEASAFDRFEHIYRREQRKARARIARAWKQAGAISSLNDLIGAAGQSKRRDFSFNKAGATGVAGVTNTLWRLGPHPAAGAAAPAAPAGQSPTRTTTGAILFDNPTGSDLHYFLMGYVSASVAANSLLLYDRIFEVNKTMSSTAAESVTGTQSRYASTTPGAADSAEGNFLFIEVQSALGATAHDWTVCTYTNQAGTTGRTLPTVTGVASAIARRLDQPANQWFCPLASGDTGIRYLTQMQCNASVTGEVHFAMGHPITWMPCPIANMVCVIDGITSSFSLVRIMNDAALAFLEICKPSTTATTYTGMISTIRG